MVLERVSLEPSELYNCNELNPPRAAFRYVCLFACLFVFCWSYQQSSPMDVKPEYGTTCPIVARVIEG